MVGDSLPVRPLALNPIGIGGIEGLMTIKHHISDEKGALVNLVSLVLVYNYDID